MAAVLALVGPVFALFVGALIRRVWSPSRRTLVVCLTAVACASALVIGLSSQFPGPEVRYAQGGLGWAVREFIISPGMGLLMAAPSTLALAGALAPQEHHKGVIVGFLAAYGSMLPLLPALLFVGCNYAGACW